MKNDTFTNIIDTVQYRMPKTNMHEERIIFTTNQLIFSSLNPWSYPYNKGIENRTYLAGGQLLCRLRGVRRCQAVFGRARQCRLVQGVPDGSGQLHGYQIAVSVGLHPL